MTQQTAFLGTILAGLQFFGYASDVSTPALIGGSFDLSATDGELNLDALVGPQGPPGQPFVPIQPQFGEDFTSSDQLPDNLLDIPLDIGKTFFIGNNVFVWDGTSYQTKQMGTQGIPGPVPQITATVEVVSPETNVTDVIQSGTALNPGLEFQLAVPPGPPGPSAAIEDATDYDTGIVPGDGDVLMFDGSVWSPSPLSFLIPQCYSIPEGSFVDTVSLDIGDAPIQIASFNVPPQAFPWKPIVFGHVFAIGVDLTLSIGAQVTLGAQAIAEQGGTGILIGRGFGNIASWANISPHFSTPDSTSNAITSGNSVDFVPAFHTGTQGTIFVSLVADGDLGAILYNNTNSQLFIMAVPVGPIVTEGS
jgi:hypothetical protein